MNKEKNETHLRSIVQIFVTEEGWRKRTREKEDEIRKDTSEHTKLFSRI